MAKKTTTIPQTVLGRAGRMLWAGAKVAAMEAKDRLSSSETSLATRIKQTQELVSTIGQLKGAAMKAGQLVGIEFSEMMPPEVVTILRQLHDSTSFMPFDQVRYILLRQLGQEKLSRLTQISPEPIAAASIGQVHRALLDGQPVAIKIQYPGVVQSIDADLAVLKKLVLLVLQMQGRKVDFEAFFTDLVASLKREADYCLEADNMEQYRSLINSPAYRVPEVVREFSTAQVLTQSFEDGVRISEWLQSNPTAEQVQHFSRLVVNLIIDEMLVNGLVQTDPNFGNFFYRPKERVLVLLDFGATNAYPLQRRLDLLRIVRDVFAGRARQAAETCLELGLVSRDESPEAIELFVAALHNFQELMQARFQPFHFGDGDWIKMARGATNRAGRSFRHTPPPTDLAFLGRKLLGMFHMLKDLNAVIDMDEFHRRIDALELGRNPTLEKRA